jgi:Na+/H+ antiporter NhaD/arsenite permease-like protein
VSALWIAVAIFVVAYVLIVSERLDRVATAMTGATLLVLLGVLEQHEALEAVDFNTLGLLSGMMLLVTLAKDSGMFQYLALWACRVGKGRPTTIFFLLTMVTAILSALLDNVTTVLLITPVIFVVANNLEIDPKPLLVGTILLSNVGGTATLIGDPPNIMIGSAAALTFNDFLINLAPVVVVVAPITAGLLVWLYRGSLQATPEAQARVLAFEPKHAITDWALLWKSLLVIGLVLVGFITHGITHLEGATIALGGASLLLVLTARHAEHELREVEWSTIFFFLGLFILVAGLEHTGAIDFMAKQLLAATEGDATVLMLALLWGSAVLSAVVDNIPYVATMIPLVQEIAAETGVDPKPLWWALAFGADIGGNATLVGASANVVVSGLASKNGHPLTFFGYLKVAVPMTVVAMIIGTIYMMLRYT